MHFIQTKHILTADGGCGMNVFRGCTHGCIYCDARSECYHIEGEFTDIAVKQNAAVLLEKELSRRRTKSMIGTGSMCDPYMLCEKELNITRECLSIIDRYGFGACVLTKSALIMRDMDLLEQINRHTKSVVQMTLTTYDENLCRKIEPHVSTTKERFEVLLECKRRGIPTVVWFDPILPYINDTKENLEGIMSYCIEAGVKGIVSFGFGLTLRRGNREYFYEQLDKLFPGLRSVYEKKFGQSYEVMSPYNGMLWKLFENKCFQNRILYRMNDVFAYIHEFPKPVHKELQLSLF